MKRLLTALLLCSASGGLANAQSAQKYDTLSNELEIMSGVLKTSLRQNAATDSWRVSQIETSYLAGQGAVFTFSVRGQSGNWVREIETLVEGLVATVPPAPPAPPVPSANSFSDVDDIVFEAAREWEAYAEETSHRFSQAFADNNSRLRDLRNMQRELAWEAREVERELRDITFELRHADEARKKELLVQKEQSGEQLKQLEAKEKSMKDELKAIEKEQTKQMEARKAQQQQAYKTFLAGFESGMSETLCRFGSGLRGLPENEHISMVLKDFEMDESRERKDRIYVFTRADIVRCVQEKIDANKLLTNANIYQF
ncbi:hypothetical protein [Alteromonas macleodii]|uniref:hypothetical protein n=1 Tax=Alteromonas macleodii TaxID=28108 RepID=UPI003BF918AE